MAIQVIQNLVKSSKYSVKCPYSMTPTRIVVHNTANDASAANEVAYMIGNNNETSFHFAVDDKQVVQGIPLNRNTWNAGDGNGKGNREGISIEICYSKSGGKKFTDAEKLAAKFIAQLLKERNWGIGKVTKHQDYNGKYCPHRTLDMGWQRFLNMVSAELATLKGSKPVSSTSTSSKKTTTVTDPVADVTYKVKTKKHDWLDAVKNLEDYAGFENSPIIGLALKVSKGSVKYRVHIKGVGWLPFVTGYNSNDHINGYAGNGKEIDAIQIIYTAPSGKKCRIKYRVAPVKGNYYDWQYGNETTNGQDGYAGAFGQSIGKVQIDIV